MLISEAERLHRVKRDAAQAAEDAELVVFLDVDGVHH